MQKLSILIGLVVAAPTIATAQSRVVVVRKGGSQVRGHHGSSYTGRTRHRSTRGHHATRARVRATAPRVRTPSVTVQGPSVRIGSRGVSVRAPGVRYVAPRVRYVAPRVRYTAPRVRYVAPRVRYAAPRVGVQVNVTRSQPSPPRHYTPSTTVVRTQPLPRAQACPPQRTATVYQVQSVQSVQGVQTGSTITTVGPTSTRRTGIGSSVTTRVDDDAAVTTVTTQPLPQASSVSRVYVAEPIYADRARTPVRQVSTGRTTLPRATPTGRVNPWDATPRRPVLSPAQRADEAAIELHVAFQAQDWATVRRYGLLLADGQLDVTLVRDAFWAQFPSPTLVRDARDGLERHCTDRGIVLSLRLVLGHH